MKFEGERPLTPVCEPIRPSQSSNSFTQEIGETDHVIMHDDEQPLDSNHQSNQAMHNSNNQSTNQSSNQSNNQSTNQSIHQSSSPSDPHLTPQSNHQPTDQFKAAPINQQFSQSNTGLTQPITQLRLTRHASDPTSNQSVINSQSNTPTIAINQSLCPILRVSQSVSRSANQYKAVPMDQIRISMIDQANNESAPKTANELSKQELVNCLTSIILSSINQSINQSNIQIPVVNNELVIDMRSINIPQKKSRVSPTRALDQKFSASADLSTEHPTKQTTTKKRRRTLAAEDDDGDDAPLLHKKTSAPSPRSSSAKTAIPNPAGGQSTHHSTIASLSLNQSSKRAPSADVDLKVIDEVRNAEAEALELASKHYEFQCDFHFKDERGLNQRCEFSCPAKSGLVKHLEQHENTDGPYKCGLCGLRSSISHVNRHLKSCHDVLRNELWESGFTWAEPIPVTEEAIKAEEAKALKKKQAELNQANKRAAKVADHPSTEPVNQPTEPLVKLEPIVKLESATNESTVEPRSQPMADDPVSLPEGAVPPPGFKPFYNSTAREQLYDDRWYIGEWGFTCTDDHKHHRDKCYTPHGRGTMYGKHNSYVYTGQFYRLRMEGSGLFDCGDFTYCGDMSQDQPMGIGVKYFKSRNMLFLGGINGAVLKRGVLEFENGTRMVGTREFDKNSLPRHYFRLEFPASSVLHYYDGECVDGVPHGNGEIVFRDGRSYFTGCQEGNLLRMLDGTGRLVRNDESVVSVLTQHRNMIKSIVFDESTGDDGKLVPRFNATTGYRSCPKMFRDAQGIMRRCEYHSKMKGVILKHIESHRLNRMARYECSHCGLRHPNKASIDYHIATSHRALDEKLERRGLQEGYVKDRENLADSMQGDAETSLEEVARHTNAQPWTSEEDARLMADIAKYKRVGIDVEWDQLFKLFPGRTAEDIQARSHVLEEQAEEGESMEEKMDEEEEEVDEEEEESEEEDQIVHVRAPKWTAEEDARLLKAVASHTKNNFIQWKQIHTLFPNRPSRRALSKRYVILQSKK